MTFGATCQVNTTVGGSSIATSQLSSINYDGVTFFFDRAMPVGFFVTGEPFVVSDQGFAITSITPASADLQGDGHVGHGAMKNPFLMDGDPQGFDGYIANHPPKITYETAYDAAVNADPAVNGPLAIAAGEKASIVKSIRNPSVTSPTGDLQRIEKYVILTVLDAAPAFGAYRPGMAGATKRIRTRDDVDFTPRGLPLPGLFPSVVDMLPTIPSNIAPLTSNGERRRLFRLDKGLGTTNDNYSAEVTPYYARLVYALNASNTSPAQAQEIIDLIITFANDLEAVIEFGGTLGSGAGQGGGMWLWLMAAAALTRDDALLQTCHTANLQPTANGFWVTSAMVGQAASGKSGVSAQTYFPDHIGIPHVEPDEAGSHHGARYLNLAADIGGWEQVAVLIFNQGPAGKADGRAMILNGASNDASNQLAATHNFLSRWYRFFPSVKSSGGPNGDWKDAWDQLLAAGAVTGWTGPPDQPPKGNSNILDNSYFTAGDGQVTLTDQNLDYATETITRRDMRWSLDGVQWIEESDVGALPFTKIGLLKGVLHWCGWRRHSASGVSPWSANFPYATPIDDGDHAERVTTSGSAASAAPVNTVAPKIHARPYPAWAYPLWSPASAALGADDIELAVGVGYWSGFPAPAFSFQWKHDGATISGATDATYTRTAADAGTVLSCEVTATNASGSVMVTTAGVTCPALAVVPQTTLIDTDFRGAFAVDYEAELAAITTNDSIASHEPTQSLDGLAGVNFGAIRCDKIGSTPYLNLPFRNAAVAGQSYAVTAQIATSWQPGSTAGFAGQCILEFRNAATVFLSTTLDPVVNTQREVLDISDSFAVPGGETDLALFARIRNTSSTGGAGRGDPMLHRLIVNEI